MRGREMLDTIENLNPAYIEAAAEKPKTKRTGWRKWGAMAACLCLVIAGIAVHQAGLFREPQDTTINQEAYGFCLEGNQNAVYFPISFEERREYGLVPEDAVGLSKENTYQITEGDLGETMGIVASCGDESMIGREVYHFAQYPDKDSICIVDTPAGYKFYVCTWLNVQDEDIDNSDNVLATYGLPESFEKMEVLSKDFTHLFTVEDASVTERIFEILSGKSNIGLEANEQRFAQAWYDAYGNDDVYYSEEAGHCVYRSTPSDEEPTTYTDDEGNTVVQNSTQDTSLYDKAHELWTVGERVIEITTTKGYQLTIDYFPSIRVFICANGYYELSDTDVEALNQLLQIKD